MYGFVVASCSIMFVLRVLVKVQWMAPRHEYNNMTPLFKLRKIWFRSQKKSVLFYISCVLQFY